MALNVRKYYGSRYLAASDLGPEARTAIVHRIQPEPVGQPPVTKLVAYLNSTNGRAWPKPLVLNQTNVNALSDGYGEDASLWQGRTIEIWADPTIEYAGKRVGGIRMRPAEDEPDNDPPKPTSRNPRHNDGRSPARDPDDHPQRDDDLNDVVPF